MALKLLVQACKINAGNIPGITCIGLSRRRSSLHTAISKTLIINNTLKNMHLKLRNLLSEIFNRSLNSIQPELLKNLTIGEIKLFLRSHKISFDEGFTCLKFNCFFCPLIQKKTDKVQKIHVNKIAGMFMCPSCQMSGTWQELQNYVILFHQHQNKEEKNICKPVPKLELTHDDTQAVHLLLHNSVPLHSLQTEELISLMKKFNLNIFTISVIKKYGLRITNDRLQLLFPVFGLNKNVVGFRIWKITPDSTTIKESVYPKSAANMMIGLQRISANQEEVILTAYPLDIIAIAQELNCNALSLPKGLSVLPVELLPLLEQFQKITLWLGNDIASWEATKMFARKLGEKRCSFIKSKENNLRPYDALQTNLNLVSIFKDSYPIAHKSIISFRDLRENVLTELTHVEEIAGVKWQRYPHLTKLLKGHRRGELTILTGPTGSGKTTFISDYSLDLCIQGVNTLWGSFEINNVRLAKMMLIQFARFPLYNDLESFHYWADKFEELPLYFMAFQGEENIKNVLAAMNHAVYVYDIHHVVVDNLQFMMGISDISQQFDRFIYQDKIIAAFRKFATANNVHVSLVIHPRKEREEELTNTSIFGSAKATQEADNILILQNKMLTSLKGKKYIQVSKNRYDGDVGIVPLEFNKATLSFSIEKKKPKKE